MNWSAGRGLVYARIGEDWRGLARMDGLVAMFKPIQGEKHKRASWSDGQMVR